MVRFTCTIVVISFCMNVVPKLFASTVLAQDSDRCGGVNLHAGSALQHLSSPKYPDTYPSNEVCQWVISAPIGHTVKIVVIDTDLEHDVSVSSGCVNQPNVVKVWDGRLTPRDLSTKEPLNMFCNSATPTIISETNQLTIRFQSGENRLGGRGFELTYVSGSYWPSSLQTVELTATIKTQYFSPPTPPHGFTRGVSMSWRITSGEWSRPVYIKVIYSNLKYLLVLSSCMEAFDGYNKTYSTLGRWCGKDTAELESTGKYIYIVYSPPRIGSGFDFKIEYGTTDGYFLESGEDRRRNLGIPAIAGIFIGALAVIGITVILVKIGCSRCKEQDQSTPIEPSRRPLAEIVTGNDDTDPTLPEVPPSPSNAEFSDLPPSYEDLFNMGDPKVANAPTYENIVI